MLEKSSREKDCATLTEEKIRIEHILIKDLPEFAMAQIAGAPPNSFVPITVQRAKAQAKHPLEDPDNVGILVACLGDEVVGYFGAIAIMLKHGPKLSRAWCFSTWNVSAKVRGRGVGRMLMQAALSLNRDYILIASKFGRKAGAQSGLIELPLWKFAQINFNRIWDFNPFTIFLRILRKVAHKMGKKLDIGKAVNRLNSLFARMFGWFGKPLLYRWLIRRNKISLQKFTIKQVERVRDTSPLNLDQDGSVRFFRSPAVVNWMLSMPWVLPPGQSPTENMEYFFSDVRPGFEFIPLEVYSQGEYQGFLVLQYSDTGKEVKIKVLDVDLPDKSWVLPIALKVGAERKADILEMNFEYAEELHGTFLGRLMIDFKKRIYQYYAASEDSPLKKYGEEIKFDLTDGDLSFT